MVWYGKRKKGYDLIWQSLYVYPRKDKGRIEKILKPIIKSHRGKERCFLGHWNNKVEVETLRKLRERFGKALGTSITKFYRYFRLNALPTNSISDDLTLVIGGFDDVDIMGVLEKFGIYCLDTTDWSKGYPIFKDGHISGWEPSLSKWIILGDDLKYYPQRLKEVPNGWTPSYWLYNVGI